VAQDGFEVGQPFGFAFAAQDGIAVVAQGDTAVPVDFAVAVQDGIAVVAQA
jgi:hypothetical protein